MAQPRARSLTVGHTTMHARADPLTAKEVAQGGGVGAPTVADAVRKGALGRRTDGRFDPEAVRSWRENLDPPRGAPRGRLPAKPAGAVGLGELRRQRESVKLELDRL